jgi:hypothetical protein
MRRRARTVLAVLRSPADTWLALRMLSWSLLLPALKRTVPLPRLARLVWSRARRQRDPGCEEKVALLARGIYRLRPLRSRDNCLERSLLAYRFLSMAGAQPRLFIGARKGDGGISGHAWVIIDGEPLFDARASLGDYVVLAEFGANGACADRETFVSWPPELAGSAVASPPPRAEGTRDMAEERKRAAGIGRTES